MYDLNQSVSLLRLLKDKFWTRKKCDSPFILFILFALNYVGHSDALRWLFHMVIFQTICLDIQHTVFYNTLIVLNMLCLTFWKFYSDRWTKHVLVLTGLNNCVRGKSHCMFLHIMYKRGAHYFKIIHVILTHTKWMKVTVDVVVLRRGFDVSCLLLSKPGVYQGLSTLTLLKIPGRPVLGHASTHQSQRV